MKIPRLMTIIVRYFFGCIESVRFVPAGRAPQEPKCTRTELILFQRCIQEHSMHPKCFTGLELFRCVNPREACLLWPNWPTQALDPKVAGLAGVDAPKK